MPIWGSCLFWTSKPPLRTFPPPFPGREHVLLPGKQVSMAINGSIGLRNWGPRTTTGWEKMRQPGGDDPTGPAHSARICHFHRRVRTIYGRNRSRRGDSALCPGKPGIHGNVEKQIEASQAIRNIIESKEMPPDMREELFGITTALRTGRSRNCRWPFVPAGRSACPARWRVI